MKSIKQQYIDLQEGRMSQANFMRNLRMALPQYINNVTSYNDSVRILRNKGILSEADVKVPSKTLDKVKSVLNGLTANNSEYHRDGYTMGFFESNGENEEGKELSEMLDPTQAEEIAKVAGSYEDAVEKLIDMGLSPQEADRIATEIYGEEDVPEDFDADYGEPNEPFDMAGSLYEAKDEKGKWTNTSGKAMYNQFDEIDNLNSYEVLIGIKYEHQKNPELTKEKVSKIVAKNLKKDPYYYTAILMSGTEGFKSEYIGGKSSNAEARQMQPVKGDNFVDKKMGMQPVKGIEKPKKDADAKKETNKTEKGIKLMSLIAKSTRGVKKMDATGEKMKKIAMKEARMNDFPGETPGKIAQQIATYVDSNPTLKKYSDEITLQSNPDGFLRFGYWEPLPSEVLAALKLQFNIEAEDIDDRRGVSYILTPKHTTPGIDLGQYDLNKLREAIREIAGAYGGDAMDAEDGSSYENE
jgi:hypothetical protein